MHTHPHFSIDWKNTPLESFAKQFERKNAKDLLKWSELRDTITVEKDRVIAKVTESNRMAMHLIDGTIDEQ